MVNFHLGENLTVALNQNAVLEKAMIKLCINDVIGEMAKSKRQAGCKWDCKELEISQDSSWASLQRKKVVPDNPRLSSVKNGLIAGL